MKEKVLIYGASGYMGQLFTRYALEAELPVVLGSRESFSSQNEVRIFALEDVTTIVNQLHDVKLVVNLAGPFVHTQRAFIEACIQTGTHYIDISGEAPEFSAAQAFHKKAVDADIMLLPGAGFGVVPTDIAASLAHQQLPDATHLTIAFVTKGGATRGTLKTILKDIHKEGVQITGGKAILAKPAQSDFQLTVDNKSYRTIYNPWRGDLITAQHSTGIPNIQTFSNFPGFIEQMMKGKLLWLRDLILNRLIGFLPVGPSEKALKKGKTYIYAEVKNALGQKKSILIKGPEAYVFTAQTLTSVATRIVSGNWKPGFQTPAIYGREIVTSDFGNVTIY